MSIDELLQGFDDRIADNGFTMMHVGGPQPWTYTIGLTSTYDHPELIITGLDASSANGAVSQLADRVRRGERFDADAPETMVGRVPVRFGEVHMEHWVRGRFNMWVQYYGWRGEPRPYPSAVQVIWPNEHGVFPPSPDFCHDHPDCQSLLDVAQTSDL